MYLTNTYLQLLIVTYTDNVDNLNLELIKIKESVEKVDLPYKKVGNIIIPYRPTVPYMGHQN